MEVKLLLFYIVVGEYSDLLRAPNINDISSLTRLIKHKAKKLKVCHVHIYFYLYKRGNKRFRHVKSVKNVLGIYKTILH